MPKEKKTVAIRSIDSSSLGSEVQRLFREAVTVRTMCGVTPSLQAGFIRESADGGDYTEFIDLNVGECGVDAGCDCSGEQTCVECDPILKNVCSIDKMTKFCQDKSPFNGIATLLTSVKKYEYIALMEDAYAETGDKPFKLKPTIDAKPNEEQNKTAAKQLFDYIETFIETNRVRVNELPYAFPEGTLTETVKGLTSEIKEEADRSLSESTAQVESVLKRTFQRANLMGEYKEVMKDTTEHPIGVLWLEDKILKVEKSVRNGKIVCNYHTQSDANRIDPCYFWATPDHEINRVGRAVFKLEQFTSGDINRWMEHTTNSKIKENIRLYLEEFGDIGHRAHEAMLFSDHYLLKEGQFDVIVTRGQYTREGIEQLGIEVPKIYKHDTLLPTEVYISAGVVLKARIMECVDENLGVYTTMFRRRGQSIFGYSLHDFISPFAKLYEGSIKSIDTAMGKSVGSLVQIDTGVLVDPSKYLEKNESTGEVSINLSDDSVIEFDSTLAAMSPNFKGVPVNVTQLPSDLEKLLPIVDFVFLQLEKITGIESILVSSRNVSSALRTDSNFNAAFNASAKSIKALLREGETRILEPSVKFMFVAKSLSGDLENYIVDAEPEILLSDTLTREVNDDRKLLEGVTTLSQLGGQLIPPERLSALLNLVGREVYNLQEDLIPNVPSLQTNGSNPDAANVAAV